MDLENTGKRVSFMTGAFVGIFFEVMFGILGYRSTPSGICCQLLSMDGCGR